MSSPEVRRGVVLPTHRSRLAVTSLAYVRAVTHNLYKGEISEIR